MPFPERKSAYDAIVGSTAPPFGLVVCLNETTPSFWDQFHSPPGDGTHNPHSTRFIHLPTPDYGAPPTSVPSNPQPPRPRLNATTTSTTQQHTQEPLDQQAQNDMLQARMRELYAPITAVCEAAAASLAQGRAVVCHCLAGRGRTSMALACIAVACGIAQNPNQAIRMVNKARSFCHKETSRVLTDPQEEYVIKFSEHWASSHS
ncbi:hypothetical protein Pelo_11874 [Pelomyxa schiedti]|nr:hypothetical protein Pelo_11874 [Pelomyxa schiedti]